MKQQPKKAVSAPTTDEIRELLSLLPKRTVSGVRARAMVSVLFGSGLRSAELLALRPVDVDLAGMSVTVHCGKGGRRRVSKLIAGCEEPLRKWLDVRRDLGIGDDAPLFCKYKGAARGHALPTRDLRAIIAGLAKKGSSAGISRRIHPHCFRHAHARALLEAGINVYTISRQLGHSNLQNTAAYLEGIGLASVLAPIGALEVTL